MTSRPGRNFGGGAQFGGAEPAPAEPAGPVRPVRPEDDPVARLVRPPVARVTEPQPVRVRPEMEGDVARYTALGLAYQPQLSQAHARVVATRLAEWVYEDPELRALVEDDFLNAVTAAGDSWWIRGDSVTETLWNEAVQLVDAVAGSEHAAQRNRALEDRDLAAATGAVDPAERLRERSEQEKEGWAVTTARAVLGGAIQGIPGVGLGVNLIRSGEEAQDEDLEEAQRQFAAVAEAEVAAQVTPELVVADMGRSLFESGEVQTLSAGVTLADQILGSMSEEDRNRLIADVRSMTTRELVERWTPPEPDETGFDEALRTALRGAMDIAQTWDAVAQTLAIGILEPFTGWAGDPERGGITRGGPGSALLGGVLAGDLSEGFEAFRRDFEALKEGGIASYYGLDPNSAFGGALNLGASILFDPTTWVTMGNAQMARRSLWMMSTPEGVEAFLRSPITVDMVQTAARSSDPVELLPITQGMSSSARRTILEATDPAVVEDVLRNETTNGFYMMNGPALGAFHQSIIKTSEIGRALSDSNVGKTARMMLARRPANRSIRLGEASFLDDATELVVARYPTDPEKAREALLGLYDRWDDYAGGSQRLLDERTLFADELRTQAATLARSAPKEVRRIPQMRAALNDVNVRLRQLDTEAAALQRQMDEAVPVGDEIVEAADDIPARVADLDREIRALNGQRESLELMVNRFGPRYDEWRAARADLLKQRQVLRRANMEASKPKSRAVLSQWVDEFMESWADEIGVPRADDGTVQWAEVTGRAGSGAGAGSVGRASPFGDAEDLAEAIGFGTTGSHHWLPASPHEMAMYQAAKAAGNLPVLRQILDSTMARVLGEALNRSNTWFAVNLLLNPVTAAKAHVEDVYKFFQTGAPVRRVARAFAAPAEQSVRWAAEKVKVDRLAGLIPRVGSDNPHSAQFVRQRIAGLDTKKPVFELVERGEPGHFDAARRWLEGTFLQDDAFRVWARSVQDSDPALWNQWWDDVGKRRVRTPVLPVPGTGGQVRALDADTAFRSAETLVDELAKLSPNPAEFKSALIRLAATGQDRVPAAIARMAGPVPVEAWSKARLRPSTWNARARAFDLAFGAPARARGGVFFEHFYDQAISMLESRWAGRIIDDQLETLVQKGFASSVEEAQWLLAVRHPQVDDLLRQMGMTTRAFLEENASVWASKHAQSLMYLGGSASSVAGAAGAKAFPFAPAQFDFLRFWTGQMFSGTEIAVSGPAEAVTRRLGEVLQRQGLESVGGKLQRVGFQSARVSQRVNPLNLNARVVARWAELAAQSARWVGDDEASDLSPAAIVANWTFLPVDFSDPESFLVDFSPGPGPIPSWLAHLLPPDHPVYDTLESVFPTLGWVQERAEVSPPSLIKHIMPATTRSLTGVVGWMGRYVASHPEAEGLMNQLLGNGWAGPIVDWQRRPYGQSDFFKHNLGNILAENPDVIVGSQEYLDLVGQASDQATSDANREEGVDRLKAYFGMSVDFGSDGQYLQHYGGLVDEVDRLAEAGVVGEAQRDQLKELWGRIESGDASPDIRSLFGDVASNVLFSLPDDQRDIVVALHPELAVNMVSTVRAVTDPVSGEFLAPEGLVLPDGRLDMSDPRMQGGRAAETRQLGFQEGWLEPRPDHDVAADVFSVYQSARWNTLRNLWEASTGRSYSDGMTRDLERAVFTFPPEALATLDRLGVSVPQRATGAEFREAISATYSLVEGARKAAESAGNTSVDANAFWDQLRSSPDYQPLMQEVDAVRNRLDDSDIGITSIWDWPDETKEVLRQRIAAVVATDPSLLADYNRYMRRALGPLDWEPPQPPPVDELEKAIEVPARFVSVEDGDTVRLVTLDGDIRVRVIGINAPEQGQVGYSDAWDQLAAVLDQAETVTVGQYRPDLFPTVQRVDADEQRIFGWLYVDGVPLYDPAVFTATNPTGAETGGDVTDLVARLAEERQRMAANRGID